MSARFEHLLKFSIDPFLDATSFSSPKSETGVVMLYPGDVVETKPAV